MPQCHLSDDQQAMPGAKLFPESRRSRQEKLGTEFRVYRAIREGGPHGTSDAAHPSPTRPRLSPSFVLWPEPCPSPFTHSRAEGRMRAALPLMLFLALTTSAPPVAAQAPRWQNAPDPIHQTIKREAARFAADKPDVAGSVGEPAPSDWSRVRKLARRTKLRVTNKGEQPRRWIFEEADDFQNNRSRSRWSAKDHCAQRGG